MQYEFAKKPYIDIRASFNSFTPANVSDKLKEKLINFYLSKLKDNPELQDKVEFDVVYSCFDFNFEERSKELDFDVDELKKCLIELTNNLVSLENIQKDLDEVKKLED